MILAQSGDAVAMIILLIVFLLMGTVCVLAFALLMRPWLQAFLSGTPVSALDVLGMRLRRTDVNQVLRSLIMANQAGVTLTAREAERALLRGADLEKLTLALIEGRRQGQELVFEDLVEADMAGRLAEMLKTPPHSTAASESPRGNSSEFRRTAYQTARICPKCSAQATDDSTICRHCGGIL